jgi:hypothetical protein
MNNNEPASNEKLKRRVVVKEENFVTVLIFMVKKLPG